MQGLGPCKTALFRHTSTRNRCVMTVGIYAQLLSHVRLCDTMDCSLPGSSVHGSVSSFSTSGDLPEPTSLVSPVLAGIFFTTAPPGKPRNLAK